MEPRAGQNVLDKSKIGIRAPDCKVRSQVAVLSALLWLLQSDQKKRYKKFPKLRILMAKQERISRLVKVKI